MSYTICEYVGQLEALISVGFLPWLESTIFTAAFEGHIILSEAHICIKFMCYIYIYKHKFTYVCTCLHKLGGQHWQCYFCMFHKTRYCWTTNLHQLKWITHLETGNLIYYETAIQLLRVSYWQGFLLTSPRHGLFWWTASLSCQNLLVHLHGFVLGSEIRFSCCKKWKG